MNELYKQYQLSSISNHDLKYKIKISQFEKLVESPQTQVYHIQSKERTAETCPMNHAVTRINCLDLDTFDQGKYLLAGHDDGSVGLWLLDGALDDGLSIKRVSYSKRLMREVRGAQGVSVPGSRRLVYSTETKFNKFRMYIGNNKRVKLDTGASVDDCGSHRYGVTTVKWYGADNGMFFTGGNDSMVKIWDTNEFVTVEEMDFDYRINQIDCLGDVSYMVVASEDRYPRVIDLRTLNMGVTILDSRYGNTRFEQGEIMTCKINPSDTNIIACGDSEGRIKVWDIRKGSQLLNELMKSDVRQRAHTRCCNDLIWSVNGGHLISIGLDGKIIEWDPFDNNIYTNEFSDGENMNYFSINGDSENYSIMKNYRVIGDIDMMRNRYKKRVSKRLELIEDKYLIVVTDYGELQIFDIEDGKYWSKIDLPIEYNMGKTHRGQFTGIAIQQDITNSRGLRLITGTNTTLLGKDNVQVMGDCPLIQYLVK